MVKSQKLFFLADNTTVTLSFNILYTPSFHLYMAFVDLQIASMIKLTIKVSHSPGVWNVVVTHWSSTCVFTDPSKCGQVLRVFIVDHCIFLLLLFRPSVISDHVLLSVFCYQTQTRIVWVGKIFNVIFFYTFTKIILSYFPKRNQ